MHHTYYRGCWHVFSRCFLFRYRHFFFPADRALHTEILPRPRGVAASGFPPLCNIPHCCLPQESGPCLSPNVAGRPLRPATDRRFGGPLPRQLPNQTRAHPIPPEFSAGSHAAPQRLCGVSSRFRLLSPGMGQVAHALLTRPPLGRGVSSPKGFLPAAPFDLHVLSTPPAFILSQDQTLMLIVLFPVPRIASRFSVYCF